MLGWAAWDGAIPPGEEMILTGTIATAFSPTTAVRDSARRWMTEDSRTTVFIDDRALDAFSSDIASAILLPSPSSSEGGSGGDQSSSSLSSSSVATVATVTEWDADGWHYDGSGYRGGRESTRMERVALYVLALDAINFCFWPLMPPSKMDASDDAIAATTIEAVPTRNGLEYEHLATALRKVAEADDDHRENDYGGGGRADDDDNNLIRSESSYAFNPVNLIALTPAKLLSLLRPHFPLPSTSRGDEGGATTTIVYDLPNAEVRCKLLNELGWGLLKKYDGSALSMISKANASADALVGIILDTFPGFRDYVIIDADSDGLNDDDDEFSSEWDMVKGGTRSAMHFYKRAQIAVADLWAALGRRHRGSRAITPSSEADGVVGASYPTGICQFHDIDLLTTFPDYRVPQVLRHMNVLRYDPTLAMMVDGRTTMEKGGIDEISIRAGTVMAVEEIVQRVREKIRSRRNNATTTTTTTTTAESGNDSVVRSRDDLRRIADEVSSVTIDWYLWQQGERLDRARLLGEHHRVVTTFY